MHPEERVGGSSLRLNERAAAIADAMVADAGALGVVVSTLENGARLIDCGVAAPGGLEAGRLLAEVCMGGAGRVSFTSVDLDGLRLPGVQVWTDHPAIACLASQYAGWAIKPEGYFAMGSGPLRALARVEHELFDRLGYAEPASGRGVLVLETRTAPDATLAAYVAAKAGLPPDRLTILVAPTATPAAGVQISARVVETALHKMLTLGFDVGSILTGFGTAPLAPIAKNDTRAIGRTNDCVLYGGSVHLTVRAEDEALQALVSRIPSSASRDYGTPFYDLFQRYGGDFYKVDPHLFSPAQVFLTNVKSGRTFQAGSVNAAVLRQSLFS
uniref:Methenyltetrahydromethanopterin cyclohydrolase n=1 Tax=uncultured bacterium BAC10-4 TaxID=333425 RepID=Q4JIS9_9BACT|nr:methylene tetrahydromethanopterin cyclohydrolase [uncultured bacterium BAC10-4]